MISWADPRQDHAETSGWERREEPWQRLDTAQVTGYHVGHTMALLSHLEPQLHIQVADKPQKISFATVLFRNQLDCWIEPL